MIYIYETFYDTRSRSWSQRSRENEQLCEKIGSSIILRRTKGFIFVKLICIRTLNIKVNVTRSTDGGILIYILKHIKLKMRK